MTEQEVYWNFFEISEVKWSLRLMEEESNCFDWIQEDHYSDYIVSQIRNYVIKYCLKKPITKYM